MAESQRTGRLRNDVEGTTTAVAPRPSGTRSIPTSPKSWYPGSQLQKTSSGTRSSVVVKASWWCSTFACVTTTPLGLLVDPEVYWRNATSCGPGRSRRAGPSVAPSTTVTTTGPPSARRSGAAHSVVSVAAVGSTSTTAASQSASMPRTRSRWYACPPGRGDGTGTSPAEKHARSPTTNDAVAE